MEKLNLNEMRNVKGGRVCPKTVDKFGPIGAAAYPFLFALECAIEETLHTR